MANSKSQLEEKLKKLLSELEKLNAFMPEITKRRIEADMGDDYRENEPAKLVMERHDVWWAQRNNLILEISNLKKQIINFKN